MIELPFLPREWRQRAVAREKDGALDEASALLTCARELEEAYHWSEHDAAWDDTCGICRDEMREAKTDV